MADFMQAVKWLKDGKKVTRARWKFGYKTYLYIRNDHANSSSCDQIVSSSEFEKNKSREESFHFPALLNHIDATDWEIFKEEGYYECENCHGDLEESDMGNKCKHCDEWTYTKDCFKPGKSPKKDTLSDYIIEVPKQIHIERIPLEEIMTNADSENYRQEVTMSDEKVEVVSSDKVKQFIKEINNDCLQLLSSTAYCKISEKLMKRAGDKLA